MVGASSFRMHCALAAPLPAFRFQRKPQRDLCREVERRSKASHRRCISSGPDSSHRFCLIDRLAVEQHRSENLPRYLKQSCPKYSNGRDLKASTPGLPKARRWNGGRHSVHFHDYADAVAALLRAARVLRSASARPADAAGAAAPSHAPLDNRQRYGAVRPWSEVRPSA